MCVFGGIYKEKCKQQWKFEKHCSRVALEGAGRGALRVNVTAAQTRELSWIRQGDVHWLSLSALWGHRQDHHVSVRLLRGLHGQTLSKKKEGKIPLRPILWSAAPCHQPQLYPMFELGVMAFGCWSSFISTNLYTHDYVSFSKQEKWMESQATS